MKYLYYILAFVISSTVVCAFFLYQKHETPPDEVALIVNDRKISRTDYEQPVAERMSQDETEGDYRESVITRELLIQEARRQGIGREENFRKAMQSFYEQSLIKVLMNRQYAEFEVDLTDEDISRYIKWINSKVTFTLFTYKALEDIEKENFLHEEVRTGIFSRFSEFVRQQLFELQPGEKSLPGRSGDMYLVFRLDSIQPLDSQSSKHQSNPEQLRKELIELKKEQLMSNWLHGLREKAKIVVLENNDQIK